jgi:hypothetical protein
MGCIVMAVVEISASEEAALKIMVGGLAEEVGRILAILEHRM